jgi:hypothetical protein
MCAISYADLAPSNFILDQTSIPDTWIEVGVYFGWDGAGPHLIILMGYRKSPGGIAVALCRFA